MKENWTYKKLGEVCESDLGKTLNSKTDTGEYYPYLCAVNILWDKIDLSTLKTTRFEFSELERYSVRKGDLLVCEGGDIGRAAIWEEDEPIRYQNALHRIRFNGDMIPRFVLKYLHFLKNTGVLDNNYGKGVTIKHLVKSSLLSIPVPVPSLLEQQHIVSELDLLQSIIDKQKAQLKELDNLAQAVFYDMFGDPIENEKGWEVKKMEDICLNIVDCPHSTPKKANRITNYPCIRTSELKEGSIYWDSMQYLEEDEYEIRIARLKPIAGDIVFGREGTIGDAVILPDGYNFSLGQRTMLLRVDGSLVSNVFLQRVILSECVKKQIRMVNVSSTVPHVNIKDFKQFEIPVPPLSLQQSFASKIESIEKQKAAINQSIAETQRLFDFTMDKYFG